MRRERELIWHPHICEKWKGGHVGDRPDVGNLAGARKLELANHINHDVESICAHLSNKIKFIQVPESQLMTGHAIKP